MIDNPATLSAKLEIVRRDCKIAPGLADRFCEMILAADDWGLLRINPLGFATRYGIPPAETVDLFVAAARAGLVDFSWDIVCQECGAILGDAETVGAATGESAVCAACGCAVPVSLDKAIEVTFRINPGVHTPKIDPFACWENFFRTCFSESIQPAAEVVAATRELFVSYLALDAGESAAVQVELAPDARYRLVLLPGHAARTLRAGPRTDPAVHEVRLAVGGRESWPEVSIGAGPARLSIVNHSGARAGVFVERADPERLRSLREQHPPRILPFLTGKTLLGNHLFRELFRIEQLSASLSLKVRSLTLLFTDLTSSTELYERIGDIPAYQLVRRHFQLLGLAVHREGGVVIKTMGDAVMATFCAPEDGVAAALRMLEALSGSAAAALPLGGLKIGVHEGPALAINNDGRLDYFGHTVNMAARIQGHARAGEIWMSAPVYESPGVRRLLEERGIAAARFDVSFKGIEGNVAVYRCAPGERQGLLDRTEDHGPRGGSWAM